MYKLLIIATVVATCLAAPAEVYRGNVQLLSRPGYFGQFRPAFGLFPRAESIESEEWGVDKREVSETEPVPEIAATTEDYDLIRIKEVNALVYDHPDTVPNQGPVSSLQ